MPSIITSVQTEPLEDFCNSLMLVVTESYIDRVSPIAEIDGVHLRTSTAQGQRQMSMDNLQAAITEIDDQEWQMTASQVAVPQTGAPIGYSSISFPKRDRTGDPRGYGGTCCPYATYWRQHKYNETWL